MVTICYNLWFKCLRFEVDWVAWSLLIFRMLYCVLIVFEPVQFLVRSRVEYFQFVVGGCILPCVVFLFDPKEEMVQSSLKWLVLGTIMIGMLSFYLYRFNASGRMSKGVFL